MAAEVVCYFRAMRWVLATLLAVCWGCSDDAPVDECPIVGDPVLEIGVPDPIRFIDFEPLLAGGDIPISSNGQTFLAVQLALRANNLDRFARISMTVTYQPPAGPARVAIKDDSQLERLFCREDELLYLVPIVVSSEDLGNDLEIADQSVDITVTVTDESQRTISGSASGVLRRLL